MNVARRTSPPSSTTCSTGSSPSATCGAGTRSAPPLSPGRPHMPDDLRFPVPEEFARKAWIDAAAYRERYDHSLRDPEGFWAAEAQALEWQRRPSRIRDVSYGPGEVRIRWFDDGALNVSVNCLDRHLSARAQQPAIVWEGDDPRESRTL